MKNNTISRAGIFAMKLGFTFFGLLAIWILGGIAEHPGMWWLYALAAVGSASIGAVLLALAAWYIRQMCALARVVDSIRP